MFITSDDGYRHTEAVRLVSRKFSLTLSTLPIKDTARTVGTTHTVPDTLRLRQVRPLLRSDGRIA